MTGTAHLKTAKAAETPLPQISTSWHSAVTQLPSSITEGWRALATEGPYGEPFFQPEWFVAYARAFLTGEPSHLVTTYAGERIVGVLPVAHKKHFFGKIPARTLSGLSGIHSSRFDFIHDTSLTPVITSSVWESLKRERDWTVLELLDVPEDGASHQILQEALLDGFLGCTWSTRRMPYMKLRELDPFGHCPATSRTFRHRLASKNRKLSEQHPLSLKVHSDLTQSALDDFFSLESRGWKGVNKSAITSSPQTLLFYRSVAQEAANRGYLKIYSLERDGLPISMHLGFQMQNRYYAPKVAYDEALARYSPGQVLVERVIKDLASQGVSTYEFLGPSAPWKRVWTLTFRSHHNLYIFRPTVTGRILHAAITRGAAPMRRLKRSYFGDPQG
jgi:CelD/BcsL family acetyltransferase involved in cellulose biosynthesis